MFDFLTADIYYTCYVLYIFLPMVAVNYQPPSVVENKGLCDFPKMWYFSTKFVESSVTENLF